MFIRLNVTTLDTNSRRPQGIFYAAKYLADEGDVTKEEAEALNGFIAWFNEYLPIPPRTVRHNLSRRTVFRFNVKKAAKSILRSLWIKITHSKTGV